ncbi:MAG: hypothetical protein HKN82_19370 [Akkermansiaceae bacterium]|nr:hypothetical protein [Akkermansiaceae bacterium]
MKSALHAVTRGAILFFAIWALIGLLGKILHLGAAWPWWAVALVAAVAVECIVALYRYEKGAVSPRTGKWLTGLRLAALAAVVWMLLQPVFSRRLEKDLEREVVIVMDDSASMHLKDDGNLQTRVGIGKAAVEETDLLAQLEGKIGVRRLRAARRALGDDEAALDGWDQSTDLAGALKTVLDQVPPDNLAGVVLVTDGRHNRPERVEDVARRFGILDAPVGIVAVGSEKPPKDAAILEVRAPDAVYLGDRVRVAANLKFDGYRGQAATVKLLEGEEVVDQQMIRIPQDHHREEVRFRHVPEEGGVGTYRLELEPMDGERFANNNTWGFETAVTDARTNVLIIDSYPRWEFRYLRNLFYGRDKSIHLQYVLLHPDTITGQSQRPVPASAARAFGDAQATELPVSEEEWRKFDVIILGDVEPEVFGEKVWETIRGCVVERAALLVAVAGPQFMPHAFRSEIARELLPVEYTPTRRTFYGEGGEEYRFALTAEGRNHPVTAQSESRVLNEKLWAEFPQIRWRMPVAGVKEGAEILISAQSGDDESASVRSEEQLGDALERLVKRRAAEAKRAVLVTQQVGNGKVAMLLTDRTWRLREGVGDVYHHRFWGQLVRWGAGPNLRAGTDRVRVGTDAMTYTGDDRITITARLWDEKKAPVQDKSLKAEVWRDGEKLATVPLAFRPGSNGIHESVAGPFPKSGRYEISLVGRKAGRLLKDDGAEKLTVGFRVVGARSPVELSETTLNRPLLDTIAELSAGQVVAPEAAGTLASLFLSGDDTREELRETTLWDHWLLFLLLGALLTSEWVVRRGSGLP